MEFNRIRQISAKSPKQYFIQRLCIISSLGILTSLSGLVPSVSVKTSEITFENHAEAQTLTFTAQAKTFSLETIWRYARAVQEINPIREEHNQQVNQLYQGDRPTRTCYQENIPWEVKQHCEIFGSKMIGILKRYQVHDVYTPISRQVQSDDNLKKKIQKAGICQQRRISLEDCF